MYLYLSTDDSTKQFPNSEHPLSLAIQDVHYVRTVMRGKYCDIQKKVRKFYNKHTRRVQKETELFK